MPHAEPKVNRVETVYTPNSGILFGTEIFCTPGVSALINNNTEGAADDLNRQSHRKENAAQYSNYTLISPLDSCFKNMKFIEKKKKKILWKKMVNHLH